MADDDDVIMDDDEEEAPKKGKKGLLIIVIILLLGGVGAGLFFSGMLDSLLGKKKDATEETHEEEHAEDDHGKHGKKDKGKGKEGEPQITYYKLPEVVANLNPGSATTSFIKIQVTVEAPNEKVLTKVKTIEPAIMDAINTYIRELRPSDLKGSAGVYRLREELLLRINKALYPEEINNILFTQLLVQ